MANLRKQGGQRQNALPCLVCMHENKSVTKGGGGGYTPYTHTHTDRQTHARAHTQPVTGHAVIVASAPKTVRPEAQTPLNSAPEGGLIHPQ